MREIFLALIAGIIVGAVFKLVRLPLPAPPVFAGIVGIVGVWLGGTAVSALMEKIFG